MLIFQLQFLLVFVISFSCSLYLGFKLPSDINANGNIIPISLTESDIDTESDVSVDNLDSTLNDHYPYLVLISSTGKTTRVTNSTFNIFKEPYFNEYDPIVSAYVNGLWLFYSEADFNWDNQKQSQVKNSKEEWVFNPTGQKLIEFKEFTFKMQSFRKGGSPDNLKLSSLTLYLGINFTGPELVTLESQYPNMPYSKPKSLIITGNQTWNLYTQANFVQKTICAVPVNGILLISDFYLKRNTRPLRHVSSVWRGGCNASKATNLYFGDEDGME